MATMTGKMTRLQRRSREHWVFRVSDDLPQACWLSSDLFFIRIIDFLGGDASFLNDDREEDDDGSDEDLKDDPVYNLDMPVGVPYVVGWTIY
jgi:hypothetical protein